MKKRYLLLVLIILSLISLFIGVSDISVMDIFHLTDKQWQILVVSRIPRLISIIVSGASLSIAGLIMQSLSRNKFVSPTTAGTMDFARLGILIAMIVFAGAGSLSKMFVAFVFALAGTFLFMKILERIKFKDAIFIPLVGLMLGNIVSSIATFFAYQNDLIQNISSWLIGDFSIILKGNYEMLYLCIPLVVITSSVVLTVGVIPFLGLIIPNVVSIYRGDHLKNSLAPTAILGAIFVLFCDILGRVIIYPYEIPINLTVGVIGSAIFIYLLLRRQAQ